MSEIKNQIRRLRFDHGEMTQEELANRAGCTRQTIIALEQSKYVPSIELAFRIARAFSVPLEEVFPFPICLHRRTSEFAYRIKTVLLFSYIIAICQRPKI
jgi:putative transcriptional regulator